MNLIEEAKAILFYKNEPVDLPELAKVLNCKIGELEEQIQIALAEQKNSGLILVMNGKSVTLATNPALASKIAELERKEESKPLTKAVLEALAIILYSGGITKHELDEIRGVNCSFILRNLMVRGLVEKMDNPKDKRAPIYIPTADVLAHMGVGDVKELENFDIVKEKVHNIASSFEKAEA